MMWKNLKIGACPKCSGKISVDGFLDPVYMCLNQRCDFKMGEEAYKRIITNMQEQQAEKEENIKEFEG